MIRARPRTALVWIAAAALVAGCAETPTENWAFHLGSHRGQFDVPAGWTVFDQGKQLRLRSGDAELIIRDLGLLKTPGETAPPTLAEVTDRALVALGHDERRSEKSRASLQVGGREALDVETWTRLAHTDIKRVVVIANGGAAIAIYTPFQTSAAAARAIDDLRASLQFEPAAIERR